MRAKEALVRFAAGAGLMWGLGMHGTRPASESGFQTPQPTPIGTLEGTPQDPETVNKTILERAHAGEKITLKDVRLAAIIKPNLNPSPGDIGPDDPIIAVLLDSQGNFHSIFFNSPCFKDALEKQKKLPEGEKTYIGKKPFQVEAGTRWIFKNTNLRFDAEGIYRGTIPKGPHLLTLTGFTFDGQTTQCPVTTASDTLNEAGEKLIEVAGPIVKKIIEELKEIWPSPATPTPNTR